MALTLRTRVIGLCAAAAVLPLAVMLAVTLVLKDSASDKIGGEMDKLAHANVTRVASDVYSMCETAQSLVMERVTAGSEGAGALIASMGPLRSGPERYLITPPGAGSPEPVSVPVLYAGKTAFSALDEEKFRLPYVDEFKEITGLDSTLFVRVNERGDMMRVVTNVMAADGGRKDIGTIMTPEMNPELIRNILAGKPYVGVVYVLDRYYAARYRPLKDESGKVVAMVGVGETMGRISTIINNIESIRVGRDGYVWVIGGRGVQKGKYIISKDGLQNGKDVTEDLSGTGLMERIEEAVDSPPGDITYAVYMWKNPGEVKHRKKIAAMTYFPEWDWVIGVALYEDNYLEAQSHVHKVLNRLMGALFIAGFVILVVVLVGAAIVASRITRSITIAAKVAEEIARGRITTAEQDLAASGKADSGASREETRLLLSSLRAMTQGLLSLIGKVQHAGIKVQGCATQIAASASQLNATVTEQAASTAQVSATSRAISQRVQGLSNTMAEVEDVARRTADLADRGQNGISLLSGSMGELKEATRAVSGKLSTISRKANSIGDIVKTITKVADQTNLLALNAAIEAEKAGDYGLGFSVVAREIKRLSDQTAAAVLDIEDVVSDMGGAVSEGNAEMGRFVSRVDQEVHNVNAIGADLSELIDGVQELFPRFSQVSSAMAEQSSAASEISMAMEQLSLAVNQTKDSLAEFSSAAQGLSQAVASLQEQSGRFSVR